MRCTGRSLLDAAACPPVNPLFPALRFGHRLFQRPSPQKQIPSNNNRQITGSAEVTVNGGSLILNGASTYTGATTVSVGTLFVTGSLGDSAVSVEAGSMLGGTGTINGDIHFAIGGMFHVADLSNPLSVGGTITFGTGFGIASLQGIDWDLLNLETPYSIIDSGQNFSLAGIENFGIANAAPVGGIGRFAYFQDGSLQVVVIPEPHAALLGGVGLLMLLRRRRVSAVHGRTRAQGIPVRPTGT